MFATESPAKFFPGTVVRRLPLTSFARRCGWFLLWFLGGLQALVVLVVLAEQRNPKPDHFLVVGVGLALMLLMVGIAGWDRRRTVRRLDEMARTLRLGAGYRSGPPWGFCQHPQLRGVRGGAQVEVHGVARRKSRLTGLVLRGPAVDGIADTVLDATLAAHRCWPTPACCRKAVCCTAERIPGSPTSSRCSPPSRPRNLATPRRDRRGNNSNK
jgi:hypothetical protein